MTNEKRQDAWSSQHDTLLAETVFEFIHQGRSRSAAFAEAAVIMNRTEGSCSSRWHVIKNQYEAVIVINNTPLTLQVGELQQKNIIEKIHFLIRNEPLKALIIKWLESGKPIIEMEKNKNTIQIINRFMFLTSKYIKEENDFTWGNYCKLQHDFSSESPSYKKRLRILISSMYIFVSVNSENKKVSSNLQRYSHLFLKTELMMGGTLKRELTLYLIENIRTNFPLASKANQIIQVQYAPRRSKKKTIIHFFSNTENTFIHTALKLFLEDMSQNEPQEINRFDYRVFIVYFSNSLKGETIRDNSSFSELTFRKQWHFYNELIDELGWGNHDVRLATALIKFYLFIDSLYYSMNGKKLLNSPTFNRDVIRLHKLPEYIDNQYIFTIRNPLEKVPNDDKWVVLPDNYKRSTNVSTNKTMTLDFTEVENQDLRTDLKRYAWYSTYSNHDLNSRCSRLIHFLNEANNFYNSEKGLSYLHQDTEVKLFSTTFLFLYHSKLLSDEKYTNSYKNLYIATIRSYLEYIADEYKILSLTINQLSYIDLEDTGGQPIDDEDFVEIKKAFHKNEASVEGELMYILFHLSITTKLRIGEILSLHRDCILSINEESGYGKIKYYSKTSHGELIEEIFLLKSIRLIQRAIELTQPAFEQATGDTRHFIFIGFDKSRKGRIMSLSNTYTNTFRKIVETLHASGKIKQSYIPYNARHTYIENAWQGVEDGTISSLEVGIITGNTANTSIKHYRNRENVQRYIEALYEISVTDVEITGEISDSEETIKDLPPVQQDAGACSSSECIKVEIEIEDSEYICLTCSKFVTTTDRIPVFENRINKYKQQRDSAEGISEKNFYTGLIDINSAYLIQMYSIMEGENE